MKYLYLGLLLLSFQTFSGDFVTFYNDEKDCSIKELGYGGSKHDALIFKGERWEMSGISGCTVPVYKKDFEEKFSICFLTAMRVMKTGECSFRGNGKHHGDDVYYFEFDDKESLHCEFSCIK